MISRIEAIRKIIDQEVGLPSIRSEEHTSELQSRDSISYAVFCLKPCLLYTSDNSRIKEIEIMDCTLRDGEQTNGVSFLPHDKLMIAKMLFHDINVDRICLLYSSRMDFG